MTKRKIKAPLDLKPKTFTSFPFYDHTTERTSQQEQTED